MPTIHVHVFSDWRSTGSGYPMGVDERTRRSLLKNILNTQVIIGQYVCRGYSRKKFDPMVTLQQGKYRVN